MSEVSEQQLEPKTKCVWKIPLPLDDDSYVRKVPVGARVLYVAAQKGVPTVWVEVDPDAYMKEIRFQIFPTGTNAIPEDSGYCGSCMTHEGHFVWHVYIADGASTSAYDECGDVRAEAYFDGH